MIRDDKMADSDNNVIYIDKEKWQYDAIQTYKDLNEYIERYWVNDKHNYILIDEVQDIEEFERSVRSFRTEPNTDIIITGSNARMLSNELSTLIGGRYKEIYIQSLSYNEFWSFIIFQTMTSRCLCIYNMEECLVWQKSVWKRMMQENIR